MSLKSIKMAKAKAEAGTDAIAQARAEADMKAEAKSEGGGAGERRPGSGSVKRDRKGNMNQGPRRDFERVTAETNLIDGHKEGLKIEKGRSAWTPKKVGS